MFLVDHRRESQRPKQEELDIEVPSLKMEEATQLKKQEFLDEESGPQLIASNEGPPYSHHCGELNSANKNELGSISSPSQLQLSTQPR
jgi:hypothetical protein